MIMNIRLRLRLNMSLRNNNTITYLYCLKYSKVICFRKVIRNINDSVSFIDDSYCNQSTFTVKHISYC